MVASKTGVLPYGAYRRSWSARTLARAAWRNRLAVLGTAIVLAVTLIALAAPAIAPANPYAGELSVRVKPPGWLPGAVAGHPLGTDQLGRDLLSRLVFGAQVSLFVGFVAVAGSGLVGVILGLLAGYYRGWLDDAIMAVADIQQSFPFLALAIALVAVLGPGLRNVVIVLAITGWVLYARVVRGEVLSVRERDFVEAARALGATNARIILRHILPNIVSPITVIASLTFAYMIVAEATLSFLGMGVEPRTPTWGGMLNEARDYLQSAWWLATFPGLLLMLTVLGINLVGDWLRDRFDPRLGTRE